MEIKETAEQFALQENKRLCVQLDYSGIVSHLIQAEIITQEEIDLINADFVEYAEKMEELYSRLLKLNSKASFDAFREAVNQLGEIALAQKLLRDQNSFGIPLLTGDTHPCLFNIDVLNKVLSYLGQPDLSRTRRVSLKWNAVIATSHTNKFTAKFRPHSGHQQMIDFVSTAPKSFFCKRITRFSLDIRTMEPAAWVFYKTFFVEFGPQIQSLQLGENLNRDLLEFIFSLEIMSCVCNLKDLKVTTIHDLGFIPNESINSLSGLETLALTECSTKKSKIVMGFLEKFLENNHKLKTLRLGFSPSFTMAMKGLPNASVLLPNLFKSPALDHLAITGLCNLNDTDLGLMTFPNGGGQLKVIDCSFNDATPGAFRDFFTSHQQTLRHATITLYDSALGLLAVLPRLEYLTHLDFIIYIDDVGCFLSISILDFCTRLPSLKCLKMCKMGHSYFRPSPQPTFVHEGLEELILSCVFSKTGEGFHEFMGRVPNCFPNLTKVEVRGLDAEFIWPNQIGQLQLQPGFVKDEYEMYGAVWTV